MLFESKMMRNGSTKTMEVELNQGFRLVSEPSSFAEPLVAIALAAFASDRSASVAFAAAAFAFVATAFVALAYSNLEQRVGFQGFLQSRRHRDQESKFSVFPGDLPSQFGSIPEVQGVDLRYVRVDVRKNEGSVVISCLQSEIYQSYGHTKEGVVSERHQECSDCNSILLATDRC